MAKNRTDEHAKNGPISVFGRSSLSVLACSRFPWRLGGYPARGGPERSIRNTLVKSLLALGLAGCAAPARLRDAPDSLPSVAFRPAPLVEFRGVDNPQINHTRECDCNNPAHWDSDTLYVFNSAIHPWRSAGPDLLHLDASYRRADIDNEKTFRSGRWLESTWRDDDGTLYGWYHNEPGKVCPQKKYLTAPRIGALRSRDNGATWKDLGLVLESRPDALRCDTANEFFAGGNGDFCVLPDARREFVYIFVSTYGDRAEQGVSLARMRYADRDDPAGKVRKRHAGGWTEPGIHGRVTPVFPAAIDWNRKDADAFWGPSVHWNAHLELYAMFLNRAVDCAWRQEGIYVSYNRDLADAEGWTRPRKILDRKDVVPENSGESGFYPQVIGLGKGETDKLAGKTARFFIHGRSRWEIVFLKPGEGDGR